MNLYDESRGGERNNSFVFINVYQYLCRPLFNVYHVYILIALPANSVKMSMDVAALYTYKLIYLPALKLVQG